MRPDVTITVTSRSSRITAFVIECKESSEPATLRQGFCEAALYRAEYGRHLACSLKAVLVGSGSIAAEPRVTDDVIAVGWPTWPPKTLLAQIIDAG